MIKFLSRPLEDSEEGFTLIELLVVILIIGILAAIAIPAFLNNRKSAVDSAVQTDLRNVAEVLTIDAMDGKKKITEPFTINEDGVFSESGAVSPFDFSETNVSEGTSLILQPSSVDGAVCLFGVNPGGDKAAESPGYVYDSNAGGFLRDSSTPSACGDETASLIVPEAAIEKALGGQTGTPGDGGSDDGTGDDGPTDPRAPQLTGKLYNPAKDCFLAGSSYRITADVTVDNVYWTINGLEHIDFDQQVIIYRNYQNKAITATVGDSFRKGEMENTLNRTDLFFNEQSSRATIMGDDTEYRFGANNGTDMSVECRESSSDTGEEQTLTYSGTMYNANGDCFIRGSEYTMNASYKGGTLTWKITSGLDAFTLEGGHMTIGGKTFTHTGGKSGTVENFQFNDDFTFSPGGSRSDIPELNSNMDPYFGDGWETEDMKYCNN